MPLTPRDAEDNLDVSDDKVVAITTASKRWTLRVRALPMPEPLIEFIEGNAARFKALANRKWWRGAVVYYCDQHADSTKSLGGLSMARILGMLRWPLFSSTLMFRSAAGANDKSSSSTSEPDEQAVQLQQELLDVAVPLGEVWVQRIRGYMCCGPRMNGANILTSPLPELGRATSVFHKLTTVGGEEESSELAQYANSLQVGFQIVAQVRTLSCCNC